MSFDAMRRHVKWRTPLYSVGDPKPHECLMIVLYDIMYLDGTEVIHESYTTRRQRLEAAVRQQERRVHLVMKLELDFKQYDSAHRFLDILAAAWKRNWEGMVAKPMDEPYVNLEVTKPGAYRCCWMKLKKDYIHG